jgi:hypothetical protein
MVMSSPLCRQQQQWQPAQQPQQLPWQQPGQGLVLLLGMLLLPLS